MITLKWQWATSLDILPSESARAYYVYHIDTRDKHPRAPLAKITAKGMRMCDFGQQPITVDPGWQTVVDRELRDVINNNLQLRVALLSGQPLPQIKLINY